MASNIKSSVGILLIVCMVFIYSAGVYGDGGFTWQKVSQPLTAGEYPSVASNGKIFVSVGQKGSIRSSADGNAWQEADSCTDRDLNRIIWDGSRFIAVGDKVILKSADGTNWTKLLDDAAKLEYVASDGKTIVAIGGIYMYTSQGGSDWKLTVFDGKNGISGIAGFTGIAWGNGRFVAIAQDKLITSADGMSWSEAVSEKSPDHDAFYAIAYGNNIFAALGRHGGIAVSGDGVSWEMVVKPQDDKITDPNNMLWDGRRFMAYTSNQVKTNSGWQLQGYSQLTSADGREWNSKDLGKSYRLGKADIAKNDDVYVCGDYTSIDGDSWSYAPAGYEGLNSVAYSGQRYVAAGGRGTVLVSSDGTHWDKVDMGDTRDITDVAYSGGYFYLVGKYGLLLDSRDGLQWEKPAAWAAEPLLRRAVDYNAVSCSENTAVIVCDSGDILTLHGREKWTDYKVQPAAKLKDAANNGSIFVAVGEKGNIYFSANGDGWLKAKTPAGTDLTRIIWDGSAFVASGYNTVLKSGNGIDWVKTNKDEALSLPEISAEDMAYKVSLQQLDYNGRMYVLSAGEYGLYYSTNCKDWVKAETGSKNYSIDAIGHNGQMFVALGEGSGSQKVACTSTDGINWSVKNATANLKASKIVWNGKNFVAVGGDRGVGRIWVSADGVNWRTTYEDKYLNLFGDIASGQDKFIALKSGTWSGDSRQHVYISSDGTKWSRIKTNLPVTFELVRWCNDSFLAFASDYGSGTWKRYILTSRDGVNWTQLPVKLAIGDNILEMLYENHQYVIIGNNAVYTSKDGELWTKTELDTGSLTGKIIYDESQDSYINVRKADILTTKDFIKFAPERELSYSIVYDGQNYYNLASPKIKESADMAEWEDIDIAAGTHINDMVAAGGKYIFVCSDGRILTGIRNK